jgi:hypothetical protein
MRESAAGRCSLAAALLVCAILVLAIPDVASAQFGVASFDTSLSSSQAGAHADFSTGFMLQTEALGNPTQQLRDASITLPPGLIGNPLALERCPVETLERWECGAASQVGSIEITATVCRGIGTKLTASAESGATTITVPDAKAFCGDAPITIGEGAEAETAYINDVINPTTLELLAPLQRSHPAGEAVTQVATSSSESLPLFNIEPSPGHVATFATSAFLADVFVQVDVGADGRLVATIEEATTLLPLVGATVTLWGVPADSSHNALRCRELNLECDLKAPEPAVAFMTNPSSCSAPPPEVDLNVSSWQGQSASSTATLPSMTGCENFAFTPSMSVTPTTARRESTAGYEVDLKVPADEDPYGLATPALEGMSVTLPDGTSLSPALAGAVQPCETAQVARASCPDGSRIGTAEAVSPLLADPLKGSLYIGVPTSTQRFPVYLSLEAGNVVIELRGEVDINQATGQVTTSFVDLPELPIESLKLNLFNGALANPPTCGPATSSAVASSYAGTDINLTSTFDIDESSEGGTCAPAAFVPGFAAGTADPLAGQFSPLTVSIERPGGQQYLSAFTVQLPAGLVGLVQNVAPCLEPEAATGTCQPGARIGTATIAAGAGPLPLTTSGQVYLTGPYAGAPLGLEILIPAAGGPFDLGSVLVRSRVLVDPKTLALTIASDPLPQSLGGIPLRLRAVDVSLDRSGFIVNPTSCAPQSITATITSSEGAAVKLSTPFRVADCTGLAFAPHVSASTQAGASAEGDGASLSFDIESPPGAQATFSTVTTELPSQLRPRLSTLQGACRLGSQVGSLQACPPTSLIGRVTVSSPAAPTSLSGAMYLVAHSGSALPSLETVLEGGGLEVELDGALGLSRNGVPIVTFKGLPDVRISSLAVTLPRGRRSILGAVTGLCAKPLDLGYSLIDQGGAQAKGKARITVQGCPRRAKVGKRAKRARRLREARFRASGRR